MGSLIVRLDIEHHDPGIRSVRLGRLGRPGRAASGSD
jgi:hypothetical protein